MPSCSFRSSIECLKSRQTRGLKIHCCESGAGAFARISEDIDPSRGLTGAAENQYHDPGSHLWNDGGRDHRDQRVPGWPDRLFLLRTLPGEIPFPSRAIASGGELLRRQAKGTGATGLLWREIPRPRRGDPRCDGQILLPDVCGRGVGETRRLSEVRHGA